MRILPITSLKNDAKTKYFIVPKCACLGLQNHISEIKMLKSKREALRHFKVYPVWKIDT